MVSKKFVISQTNGLHLRPAAVLCETALEFQASIKLHVDQVTADAKSVLGVLACGVKDGKEIELICEGPDEEEALIKLEQVIRDGFPPTKREKKNRR